MQEPVAMNDINVSNKCITEHLINQFFIKVEGKEQGQKLKESTAKKTAADNLLDNCKHCTVSRFAKELHLVTNYRSVFFLHTISVLQ